MLKQFPALKSDGLKGGFQYFDASMWDDLLAVETVRAASSEGAVIANYVEAVSPVFENKKITGFHLRDPFGEAEPETPGSFSSLFFLKATRVISCVGPWTDQFGKKISPDWKPWLNPSKGIHLVFDLKQFNLPGALVMTHPVDGRISFAIPRADFGAGVVIVGTTDSPTSSDPSKVEIEATDVHYLMDLLHRFFPSLKLNFKDILSAYVGVRPLVATGDQSQVLQEVSREHTIGEGPGGVVFVAGGKYTTHRTMAKEIVDFTLSLWKKDFEQGQGPSLPLGLKPSHTAKPFFEGDVEKSEPALVEQKGADQDPAGFPDLAGQLRKAIQHGMVLRLEDFYLRRLPLFLSRADHGLPWAERLSKVWAQELGKTDAEALKECEALKTECAQRSKWAFDL